MTTTPATDYANPDPLLTVAQAAEYLSLSDPHIRRAIRSNELEVVRFGRALRIRSSQVRAYLEARETGR
ncbi:helix-turn-helix domain-containing protein [Aeromicrobium senzhongii]|uniref:Helix-turn-helix domain-containing protein n=1 Tax=Aeromicrobium senzhongii TaxID=2663859 RepID=A0ABX6ST58_9ACTN|nr:helix-turn-helix domain-containing protein [Aeromicrobium senzhongii]MTB88441.1 excisionase family DNA-binding protein [Aeromicrobium senzhongii]QNL94594.1 helix-turn-helix domain-containing protein [Aeromicrobium senzhongii]